MIRSGLVVLRDAVADRLRAAPGHQRVDQSVAAAALEVAWGEAEAEQVASVVGGLEIVGQAPS